MQIQYLFDTERAELKAVPPSHEIKRFISSRGAQSRQLLLLLDTAR
jgi:hypothetical protein